MGMADNDQQIEEQRNQEHKSDGDASTSLAGDAQSVPAWANYCFGCGADNPEGLGLKFVFNPERNSYACNFTLSRRFTGPPGHAHGGIIATILDEAMGKVNNAGKMTAVTHEMTVEYRKLVPLGKPLIAEGWQQSAKGRIFVNVAELRSPEGEVLARSKGIFVAVDARKMFAGHLEGAEFGEL
jgi:acyl-coenzyme A thioesterase PaaI-like protein